MNTSLREVIDRELLFLLKYNIYAFFYYTKIFPKQCFYFDDFMTDFNNKKISLPTLYSTFFDHKRNSIQEWFTELERLISKKKLLKIIINCHKPGIIFPVKQLVIDFYDNDQQTSFNKECMVNEVKDHKIKYLSKILKEYKSIKNTERFHDIEDAAINMKFVYKNKSDLIFNCPTSQPFKKKKYTDLKYEYMDYLIYSRINTFEGKKSNSEDSSIIKKRKLICSSESVKKDNEQEYVYSEIEETDLEENAYNESPTKLDHCSNVFLDC